MEDVIQINEECLDFDEDQAFFQGRPFKGIARCFYLNNALKREAKYTDGFEEGICREWHPNGQLMRQWFAIRGCAHGEFNEWHDNGQVKSVRCFDRGIELSYEEWDASGDLVERRVIDKQSELYKYVLQRSCRSHD
jgi:antitoxin component YwqK of YwqJK toxin-antitoxin module